MKLSYELFMKRIAVFVLVLAAVIPQQLAFADTYTVPAIPQGVLSDQLQTQISNLYKVVNGAPVTCAQNCPSWEQTKTDLTNAQSQVNQLLDTLDAQAKVMLPELTNLALNKNDFETLVLSAGGKSRSNCAASGPLVYHFESFSYCFNHDTDIDSFLANLSNYGQNKPSRLPTRSLLSVLNILTTLSDFERQISSNLQAVTISQNGCATNVLDPRCSANATKQNRIDTHDTGILGFTDMQDHWAKQYVEVLFAKGVVKGRTATLFGPDLLLTRAELMKMVILATNKNASSFATRNSGFSDVPQSYPLASYVTYAHLQGWINGSGGRFYPDRPVSSFEAIKIIFNAFGVALDNTTHSSLPGVPDGEQAQYIETARIRNLTTSPDMPELRPDQPITRANVARIIASLLK